jgi:hypothetical protein
MPNLMVLTIMELDEYKSWLASQTDNGRILLMLLTVYSYLISKGQLVFCKDRGW